MVGQALVKTIELKAQTGRSTTTLRSLFSDAGLNEVELLGERRRLRRIVEALTVANRARFKNEYSIDDASGRCLKSRQLAVPTMPFANPRLGPSTSSDSAASIAAVRGGH